MSKQEIQATVAYLLVTFPLAVVWHVVMFGGVYDELGYFGREPSFAMGFAAILIQGVILAILYGRTVGHAGSVSHWLFVALVGIFLWTSNVLAFAAKSELTSLPLFLALETGYFATNFAIYGAVLRAVFGRGGRG